MEENVQVIAKRVWHIVRVAFFMVRKSMNKKKLLLDLKYLTMKRPKLAGKSLAAGNLTLHHHHHGGAYEFSCSNTPNYHNFFPDEGNESEIHAVNRVLDMMAARDHDVDGFPCYTCSPVLPGFGFGRSPMVRQLMVTDSPYPCQNGDDVGGEMGNYRVDEAAEEFIQKFYTQLMQQRITD